MRTTPRNQDDHFRAKMCHFLENRDNRDMSGIIVRSSRGITLLGGGKARPAELREALTLAPVLVAADGGADFALRQDVEPEAVIGDMDSLSDAIRAALPARKLHRIAEQNSTDFDKALRSVEAPLVLGVGFLGRRVDHQLANFNVLARRYDRNCILLGKHDVILAAPAQIELDLAPRERVSLFPMAEMTGRSQGLHWPIEGLTFRPDGVTGSSNRVSEGPVKLEFDSPGMLLILPRRALTATLDGLARARQFAPAR
ncbi:thiamine diphosphokinase [Tropicimonas sp. TH_r6]|uniref:thiamine diphosphokinase n=1 Tax=Tropicimonas sp. TH_r6 TaxID=3082085 RepID=UPI0029551D1B|nr:thiamine diphosphokinase [Tropicimonas sp. TH_r6]MDV7144562.1 thiamine diphosphokinase [Tropicimonas sp. TH_r6]